MSDMQRSAIFSPDRVYRYTLTRRWEDGPTLNVIGLNPSTANETSDDPTIRRCIRFARDWGYSGLVMTNLCAFRATKPVDLWKSIDSYGPDNEQWVRKAAWSSGRVLIAWGANVRADPWARYTLRNPLQDRQLFCLGLTKAGAPRHPLYVPAIMQPVRYR